jgi:Helix-turn-helix domain
MKTQPQVPILCTRAEAAHLLACSVATVIRLQREGRLCGLRLTGSRTGQVYFRREDILALAKREPANAE